MKNKNQTILAIILLIGCFVFLILFGAYTIVTEDNPDWSATYQEGYMSYNGGYCVKVQNNLWTYADGRKDSLLWVFIEPDHTMDVGYQRLSFHTVDYDFDGELDCINILQKPSHQLPYSESELENITNIQVYLGETGEWRLTDLEGKVSASFRQSLMEKIPFITNLHKRALLVAK
ncbi:hypothetical protein KKA39_00020 [Patescibacteria group bacterium]|nr:hypothetical protein [Patescibacteria group bacterium]